MNCILPGSKGWEYDVLDLGFVLLFVCSGFLVLLLFFVCLFRVFLFFIYLFIYLFFGVFFCFFAFTLVTFYITFLTQGKDFKARK